VIRAVTFDFWNTIARTRTMAEVRSRAVAIACKDGGVDVEEAALAAALEQVGAHWERSWSEGVHLHPRQGAEMLVRELGVEDAAEELVAAAFLEAGHEADLDLAPEVDAVLAELAGRGIRLGIVCDVGFTGGESLRRMLDREGLLRHFSGWAFSDEVGYYKPDPRTFEAALSALGASPGEALHIGDLRRTDIAGAAALGMRTARYRGFHDDLDSAPGIEADHVLDSHRELLALMST
jgi:HAD superfamily hydrolase (TIGR01549 family)